jgi:uncharacterized RDD family membrane protein YckC
MQREWAERPAAEPQEWGSMSASEGSAVKAPSPYAGAVSRLVAYMVDHFALTVLFSVGVFVVAFITDLVTGHRIDLKASAPASFALAVWWVAYFSISWAVTGATLGMTLLGVRVERAEGGDVGGGRALVRALAWPLSALLFGLGFVGILVQRQRRALHDFIAGTVVVYSGDTELEGSPSPAQGEAKARVGPVPSQPASPRDAG